MPTEPPNPSALETGEPTSRKKIISWAMWDWGTQPFATVVTTFVFAVYLTSESFGSTNYTSTALSIATAAAGVFVALLAPVLGQMSDRSGHIMRNLRLQTWGMAAITALMYFVAPDPSYLWLGLGLLAVGTVLSEIAGVNNNAMLDVVASPRNVGRVSGFGWGMGYLGGIVVLLALNFLFIAPERGLFGVSNEGAMDIRVSMVMCAVWTLLFTLPTFINLRDRPKTDQDPRSGCSRPTGCSGRPSSGCGAPAGTPCTSWRLPRCSVMGWPGCSPLVPSSRPAPSGSAPPR